MTAKELWNRLNPQENGAGAMVVLTPLENELKMAGKEEKRKRGRPKKVVESV